MFLNAKNGQLPINGTEMPYAVFGRGSQPLIILPGVGDGLRTVKGAALPLAWLYRDLGRKYRVYAFSRVNRLPEGYTTRQMAQDLYQAIQLLELAPAQVLGVSQGGMIAQYLAIDHPAAVQRLILAVSTARPTETLRTVVGRWLSLAAARDHRALFIDSTECSYSPARLSRYRRLYPLLAPLAKPRDFRRFIIQAQSCLTHDALAELGRISCPTLVMGGDSDRVVGAAAAPELAAAISHSQLLLYPGLGHAAYEEAPDFIQQVLAFLRRPL